jgi:hypothetical protein
LLNGINPDEKYFPWILYSAPSELKGVWCTSTPGWRRGLFIYGSFRASCYNNWRTCHPASKWRNKFRI